MKSICEYTVEVKEEVCNPQMLRYGFKRGDVRLFYVTNLVSDENSVTFTCPDYNGVTKEDISPTFEVSRKAVIDISKIDDKYYKIPNDSRSVDDI